MKPTTTARKIDSVTQTVALIGFIGLMVAAILIFYDGGARYLSAPRIHGLKITARWFTRWSLPVAFPQVYYDKLM